MKEHSGLVRLAGSDSEGLAAGAEHGLIELDRDTSLGLPAGLDVGRIAWAEDAASRSTLTFQGDEFEPSGDWCCGPDPSRFGLHRLVVSTWERGSDDE